MKRLMMVLLLTGCSGSNTEPVRNFTFTAPRPFGYVLGDEITQRIEFDTENNVTLQTASLPAKGQVNRWLNLNDVFIKHRESGGSVHHELTLRYQVFYAALEVKLLTIPGFNLSLQRNGKALSQAVPAWAFNISPLRELAVRKTENGEYKRPDTQPELLSTTKPLMGLSAGLLISFGLGIYLAGVYGVLPKPFKRNAFKSALKQLKSLSKDNMAQALSAVHQAFNQLYAQPLFHNRLADFYIDHPEYQQLSAELDWFFNCSNRFFFSQGMIPVEIDLEKLHSLCQSALNIERGKR
ncbi:MAG: nonribosomal peptide synthetase MxaA [Methylococcales bacterium]